MQSEEDITATYIHSGKQHPPYPLIDFNRKLQREAGLSQLNETYLENLVKEFQAVPQLSRNIKGLTLTRLTELALICAGNYADNGEITTAGDLMVNPPQVMVYLRGNTEPILKKRHEKLTAQFKHLRRHHSSMIHWLIHNSQLEIRQKPLLPKLCDMMSAFGAISDKYIATVDQRMKQIADTMGFLSAWKVGSAEEFHQKLKSARPSERGFIHRTLCRFDRRLFDEMWNDIGVLLLDSGYRSRFVG
ncbi:uncharacterized protein Dmul_15020 [Desulfococcus multivorans]|nr:uncharacterized protein Dmul_15020 [Desulfococcus multivorans]